MIPNFFFFFKYAADSYSPHPLKYGIYMQHARRHLLKKDVMSSSKALNISIRAKVSIS